MIVRIIMIGVLLAGVFASALSMVAAKHESRQWLVEQQNRLEARTQLEVEWTRLQLELAVWAAPSRIERKALEEAGMRRPEVADTIFVEGSAWAR
ncbi:MAG: cell division protein FtsL [Thioalkalivibrionaceae bacterium]